MPVAAGTCPGTFRVLHDDHIGPLAIPKGAYTITTQGIGGARAANRLAAFLQDFDGRLPPARGPSIPPPPCSCAARPGPGSRSTKFALWVRLEDVYWSDEGRTSFDAVVCSCALAALVAAVRLAIPPPRGRAGRRRPAAARDRMHEALGGRAPRSSQIPYVARAEGWAARDGSDTEELAAIGALRYAMEAAVHAAETFVRDGRQDSARRAAARAEELHAPDQGTAFPAIDGNRHRPHPRPLSVAT